MPTPSQTRTRLWLPLVANLVLIVVMQMLNEWIAPLSLGGLGLGRLSVSLHLEALLLLFPLLYLRYVHALPTILITAFLLDSMDPVPLGLRMAVYTLLMVSVLPLRVRIRRENPMHVAWLGVFINLIIFTATGIAAVLGPSIFSSRLVFKAMTDLLLSEAVVAASGFFWVEFQRHVITALSGDDPAGYPITRSM